MDNVNRFLDITKEETGQMPSTPPEQEGIFSALAGGAIEAIRSGVADLPRVLQKLSDASAALLERQGLKSDRTDIFKRLAEAIEPTDFQDQPTLARKIGRAIGGIITAVPKYTPAMMAGPAMIPAFAATGGLTAWGRDAPPAEIAKQAALDAAFGGMLKGAGGLARWPRAGALAAGAGGLEEIATGGEVKLEDLMITMGTMATLGSFGGRWPRGLKEKLNKLNYPNEALKDLTMKDARRIVREKIKFDPITKVVAEPAAQAGTAADNTLRNNGYTDEEIAAIPSLMKASIAGQPIERVLPVTDYVQNKILLAKGFDEAEVAAMPYQLKVAIVNSGHYPESLEIDGITGQATLTGVVPKEIPTAADQTINTWTGGYKGPKVENLAVTKEAQEKFLNITKEETSKMPNAESIPIRDQLKQTVQAYADQQGVDVDQLAPEDIARVMKKTMTMESRRMFNEKKGTKAEREKARKLITKATAKLGVTEEEFGKLSPGEKIDLVTKAKIPNLELTAEEKATWTANHPPELLRASFQDFLSKRIAKLEKEGKTPEEVLDDKHVQFLQDEIANIPGGTEAALAKGAAMTYEEAVLTLGKVRKEPDPFKQQALREQVEGYLGLPKTQSMTYARLVEALSQKKPKTIVVKKGKKEARKLTEAEKPTKADPALVTEAAIRLGWDAKRLEYINDSVLTKMIDERLTPENSSLTVGGEVVKISKGDKALATILNTEPAVVAETKPITIDQATALKAAADWAEMSQKLVEGLPDDQKQLLIDSYLTDLDKKIVIATKTGDAVTKADEKSAQQHNEVMDKDTATNSMVINLEEKANAAIKDAADKKRLFNDDLIDKADYALAEQAKNEAFTALDKKRTELQKKAKQPLGKGKSEKLGIIDEKGAGGLVVRRKISDTVDEFSLLNKDSRPTLPGESGVNSAGRITVEVGEDRAIITSITEPFNIERAEALKVKFIDTIREYYVKQGKALRSTSTDVTLRSGIDTTLMKEIAIRTKDKMISIYKGFGERKGPYKGLPRDKVAEVYKDMMEGDDKIRLSESEVKEIYSQALETPMPPKGDIPTIGVTDLLGQAIANKNPDVVKVQEAIAKYDVLKRQLKDALVWNKQSKLNQIYERINAQPKAKDLREQVSDSFIRQTTPTNPLVLEAKVGIESLMSKMADVNNLRARGHFVNEYFPLIADMENTYTKIKGMFGNINTREELPERYKLAGDEFTMGKDEFNDIKYILQTRKSWKDLSNYQKNKIRYNVLSFEGIYDNWAYLPESVIGRIPKETFNRHLQERTGGGLLSYKHDSYDVLRSYLTTMIDKEADNLMLKEVRPIVNNYAGENVLRSVRWYMSRQVKMALGTRTIGSMWMANEIARLNDFIGREVVNPNFPSIMAGRIVGGAARGLLGPDTALRNILQSIQTVVEVGPGAFSKGLYKFITRKGITEEEQGFFKMLLGAEEYTSEGLSHNRPLGERLVGKTKLGKVGAFYSWLGDMALNPMRATEHFNKFVAFQSALSEAAEKGWSFEKGVRVGLLKVSQDIPDLTIPHAYWEAYKSTLKSQYGYSKVMRTPLLRGPLAKISTVFWSYPANTIQFMTRGLVDGALQGDLGKMTRFALYAGFQLTIATAMMQLGYDVGAIFGMGLLPVKAMSVPWEVMKNAYLTVAGSTGEDRSKGSDDFLNALGSLTIPQFRYGKKVLKKIKNLQDGYISAGTREMPVMETSPFVAIMDLLGFPPSGPREAYDLVQQTRDTAYEYGKNKQDLVLKGIRAIDKGNMGDVKEMFDKARESGVVITMAELGKYYRLHKTKTYLETALQRLPKHLRPPMEKKIKELEQELMPHRFGLEQTSNTQKPMWSNPNPQGTMEEVE